jgi:hypothetical protein
VLAVTHPYGSVLCRRGVGGAEVDLTLPVALVVLFQPLKA